MRRIWLERALWGIGTAGLFWTAQFYGWGAWKQNQGEKEVVALTTAPVPVKSAPAKVGSVLGRIEIPRLNSASVIFEGSSDEVLDAGVGHVEGTSFDLGEGNIALAAHRDTFFKQLGQIRSGDTIQLTSAQGVAKYTVQSTEIVQPWNTEVLRPTEAPTLTLITCYPFEFFGHAPQRFIVHAVQVDRSLRF